MKYKAQHEPERCDAAGCRKPSETILEGASAAKRGRGRIELCDEHLARALDEREEAKP